MFRMLAALLLASTATWQALALPATSLPNQNESVKFAVLGDNGTGDKGQYETAAQMVIARRALPFAFVIMLGDNFYGSQSPDALVRKFDRPYKPLIDAGVTFHAAIGNHDDPGTVHYPPLNMNGQRYYTYVRQHVRFVVLDTNVLDAAQLRWFESALGQAQEPWKIVYFHHPLYGNAGRHGAAVDVRLLLEPILLRHRVNVVFSGHDHIYERLKPQKGIHYFVAGSGGKLRKGDLARSPTTAAGFDQDQVFMLVEVGLDQLWFEAISRTGAIVDSGAIPRTAHAGTR
jgi:hypothetical protein